MSESTDKKSDIVKLATERYKYAKSAWANIYAAAENDIYFLSDAPNAQWPQEEVQRRRKRPILQIDQLSQFVHQVSNDIRMNTPTIKVIPAHMEADPDTAEAIMGRIKAIEYKSNADAAYDMAADFAVRSSIGFIRVDHDYIDDESFDQELRICRIVNPQAILLDPDSKEPDGSDAKYAFVFDEMAVSEYTELYPDAEIFSFGEEKPHRNAKDEDRIIIAEYFVLEHDEKEYGKLRDGTIELVERGSKKRYASKRKVTKTTVMRYKLCGNSVLEDGKFPGKYIPIVPVYGEEVWEKGERKLLSLIRKSKSAQYMYNLWKSLETELLLKQPQSPFTAAAGQITGFEEQWKDPERAMVLLYNQKDSEGNPAPPPQRSQPPTIPTGIVNAARETVDDIKATMGLYNASIGNRSNETSGVAIQRRQQEGDVATFHFGDNLVRSITQVGKILVCALPEIEDTKRVVQIIGKEDEPKMIGINGAIVEGQEQSYDFTKAAKYDVRVITGASFTTQRQEAAALYTDVVKTMPDLMPVIGDLVFKYQDAPGAQAISSRLKKLVDPKLLDESEREDGQVDPQVEQLNAQLQQVTTEAQQIIQEAQQKVSTLESQLKQKQSVDLEKSVGLELKEIKLSADEEALRIKSENERLRIQLLEAKAIEHIESVKSELKPLEKEQDMPIQETYEETIEMLQAKIAAKLQEKEAREMELQNQIMMEQQRIVQEQAEREAKAMQTQMVIEALGNISNQLGQLTATVSQPIDIKRDENGNIIEVS